MAAIVGAVAIVAAVAAAVLGPNGEDDGGSSGTGRAGDSPAATRAPVTATTTASPSGSTEPTVPVPPSSPSAPATSAGAPFRYQMLWPFRTVDEARRWEREGAPGGHQPWHWDAEATALSFVRGFLGFTAIDRVSGSSTGADGAHVAVGSVNEDGTDGTAAVIHLVRLGSGSDAPWEVVGTRDEDTMFSLTTPSYGARISSPVVVGGRVSGVDESIRVQVRQPSSTRPLGESCCTPAGGSNIRWSTQVSFSGATDPVLTIVASTGGHLTDVERFAVTGVRRVPS